jgi:hypothetical protein
MHVGELDLAFYSVYMSVKTCCTPLCIIFACGGNKI